MVQNQRIDYLTAQVNDLHRLANLQHYGIFNEACQNVAVKLYINDSIPKIL